MLGRDRSQELSTKSPQPGISSLLTAGRAFGPLPIAGDDLVFSSDRSGLPRPYRAGAPLAAPRVLFDADDRVLPIAETGHGLLVKLDRGGNETWQLALISDGRLRHLTTDEKAIHRDVTLAPDGRSAGLVHNPGGRDDWAVGVIDLATGRIDELVDEGGYWHLLGWSPDGQTLAVAQHQHTLRNQAYLFSRQGGRRRLLPDAELVDAVAWADDQFLALTDHDRDFVGLVEVDPDRPDRVKRRLVDEHRDVVVFSLDPRGKRLVAAINDGPYDEVRFIDATTGGLLESRSLPPGAIYSDMALDAQANLSWSPDGSRLYAAWESSNRPAEIYELLSGERWTRSDDSDLEGHLSMLKPPEQVSYRSFDGLEVPALHFRVGDGVPRPTVVWLHGGPESQLRAGYNPVIAMWQAAGYDVLAPNVRGSTGYGRRYFSLDDRQRRWDAVRDAVEAGRWLRRQGLATGLVAMGRSYGGFMTLAVLVEDPGLWDAGIDVVGIADWHSFFRNTSGWRRSMRTAEYGEPEGPDGDFLREFSPLRRAAEIRAPLLIIHGRNDVRVPVSEAVQIHQALPGSELIVFDDEGHGITRHDNLVTAYGRALEFVRERARIA